MILQDNEKGCKEDYAASVKRFMPHIIYKAP